jgi:hypothetical protein
MALFFRKSPKPASKLPDAVCEDAQAAFARFVAARKGATINALALCSVDDAVEPYIMGATLEEGIGPIGAPNPDPVAAWSSDPADWSWSDGPQPYKSGHIIGAILDDEKRPFEERAEEIFGGIVAGLKKFDASGQFKGKLPREQMLLVLWINDPSDQNAEAVMKWVAQMNPKPVSDWFSAVYSYRP